jgi:hypothetical protein
MIYQKMQLGMPPFSVNLYPKRSARSIPLFKVMCFPKTVEAKCSNANTANKERYESNICVVSVFTSSNRDSNVFKEYQNGFPTQFLPRD